MKKFLSFSSSLGILGALALAFQPGVATAQFNPITLTPGSYTFKMVVQSNYLQPVSSYAEWVGSGFAHDDTTYFEQGLFARKLSDYGGNIGIPPHNTVFTSINDPNIKFLMPPSYMTNDDLIIVNNSDRGTNLTGTITLATPTTATHIALLAAGGNGGAVFNYSVNHVSGPPDTGNYAVPDWFAGGPSAAWGCDGRINGGGYDNLGIFKENENPPYLNTLEIKVSSASPVTSIDLSFNSGGGADNFFAVSASTDGVTYTPAPLNPSSFLYSTVVAASVPFPVTATMDNGTNIEVDPGTTWFEAGYDTNTPSAGLPPSGTSFVSISAAADTYTMGNYSTNDAVLIDSSHLSANITPATPAAYNGLSFLTAGGNVGSGNVMSNTCVVQHQDGVNETNWVYGYDWFDAAAGQFIAYSANERIDVGGRYLETNTLFPYLFESFVPVTDPSDVTNIVVGYGLAPGADALTAIMAVSGSTAAWGPTIQQGPNPGTQALNAGETATFTVSVVGSGTITNSWLVENSGTFVPLTDGKDANGSVISGSSTTTLTITGLTAADAGSYEYIADSLNGSETSSNLTITISSGTSIKPIIDGQFPTASFSALSGHTAITPFSVVVDATSTPPISYQWYQIVGNVTNAIAGASGTVVPGTTNTYNNVDTTAASIFCVLSNFVGTAATTPVAISLIDSLGAATTYGTSILALKPVAYWPLDETNGIIAFDHAGNNDGTYIGGCTLAQPGIPASAALAGGENLSVAFDGTSGYVTIPAGNSNLNITGPITVIQWVQTPAGGESGASATSFGHGADSYSLYVVKTAIPEFADTGNGSGGTVNSSVNINDGNWHMLAGVFNGSSAYLYVDGVEQGGSVSTETDGQVVPVTIGTEADNITADYYAGNIAQCAIFTNAFTAAQIQTVYQAAELPPGNLTISPAGPSVYVGRSVTLTAAATLGNAATSYQWYVVNAGVSNNILGATSATYTLTDATIDESGETIGVIAGNSYGSTNGTTTLTVSDSAATLVTDLAPTNAEAASGTSVTYTVTTGGSLPINFQWTLDGSVQSSATNSVFTFPVTTGSHVIQVSFSNELNSGTPIVSSPASLKGLATAPTLGFNTTGVDWETNSAAASTVPTFSSNVLALLDGTGGEISSAYYDIAQYVGSFTASFVYTVHTFSIPSGDGFTFMMQNSAVATNALGSDIGYSGILNSVALEINIFDYDTYFVNAVGITVETNGVTYEEPTVGAGTPYGPTGAISMDSGDPIQFNLSWANGVLAVNIEDQSTSDTYSTNYTVGSLIPILGANLAYIGFSASDIHDSSDMSISDFVFNPGGTTVVTTGPTLTISGQTATSFQISWPTSATGLTLQTASTLAGPWTTGPASTVVGANNVVTITIPGTGAGAFYRLAP